MKYFYPVDRPEINFLRIKKEEGFLINKLNGNWHEEKTKQANTHEHGADLIMTGGSKNGERFIIECKGKSYAKSARSINKEGWLNALGQIITRMTTSRVIKKGSKKGEVSRSYKYGLGLYWVGAQVALSRIPRVIAQTLNLYVFSCDDDGNIKQFTPSQFQRKYSDEEMKK